MQSERITLALLPQHVDYIALMLQRCAWAEANPIINDLQQQVTAYNRARADTGTLSDAVQQAPDRT